MIAPACLNEESAETSGVFVIRPDKNTNGNFVSYYTGGNESQKRKLANKAQGTTIIHLYYQSICDETIMIPDLNEQEKISNFFIKLDDSITLHQCEQTLIFGGKYDKQKKNVASGLL